MNVTDVEELTCNFSAVSMTKLAMFFAFLGLFILGISGNAWVAYVVGDVLFSSVSETVPKGVQCYIFALCISNILVLLSMPLVLANMLCSTWIFGNVVCKIYYYMDNLKFVNPLVLAALSITCYVSICKPMNEKYFNDRKVAMVYLGVSFSMLCMLMSPVPVIAKVTQLPWTVRNKTVVVKVCGFLFPQMMSIFFHTILFLFLYLVPAGCIITCHCKVLCRVYNHTTQHTMGRNVLQFWRVARIVMGLVLVFLVCWTPYMIFTSVLLPLQFRVPHPAFGYILHYLPYIACSGYPIIYTVLNRGLQDAHTRIQSMRKKKSRDLMAYRKDSRSYRLYRSVRSQSSAARKNSHRTGSISFSVKNQLTVRADTNSITSCSPDSVNRVLVPSSASKGTIANVVEPDLTDLVINSASWETIL